MNNMWHFSVPIMYIPLAFWVLFDAQSRKDKAIQWAIGTALLGPIILPIYLAKRPLKAGEIREGGTNWNIFNNFALLWAILGVAAVILIVVETFMVLDTTYGYQRAGAIILSAAALAIFVPLWLVPVAVARFFGDRLKKSSVVEKGPTGPLADEWKVTTRKDERERVDGDGTEAVDKVELPSAAPLNDDVMRPGDDYYDILKSSPLDDYAQRFAPAGDFAEERACRALKLLKHENPERRLDAVKELAYIPLTAVKEVIPALIQALEDEDPFVRKYAIRALENLGPVAHEATPALIQKFEDREIPSISGEAWEALTSITGKDFGIDRTSWQRWWDDIDAKLGDEKGIEAVLEDLKDWSGDTRADAIYTLNFIRPQASIKVVRALIQALEDEDFFVRCAAARALSRIRPAAKEAVPALIQVLKKKGHPNPFLPDERVEAARALMVITGQYFGGDPDQWQEWWDEQRDSA